MRTIVTAAKRPFEFDEVLTKLVSQQHGLRGIWECLNAGMDGQPPLYYVVERAAQWLVPNAHVAYRLPSILAFVATMVLLYIFVKTRSGLLPAFISAAVLLMSEFSWLSDFQARPYMLPTACASGAMVCYQRISSRMGFAGFFLSLVLASTVHFYAIFLLMAFCLAELAYVWQAKKVRGKVWFALLVSPVPVVVCARILLHLNQLWGAHYWAAVEESHMFVKTYGNYWHVEGAWGAALVVTLGVGILISLVSARRRPGLDAPTGRTPASELVLVLALAFLPIVGCAAAKAVHSPYVDRYFLPSILGISAIAGFTLGKASGKRMSSVLLFVMEEKNETSAR